MVAWKATTAKDGKRQREQRWALRSASSGARAPQPPSTPTSTAAFVDCTLGAAGHSLAMMEAHPEMELYVGMDVDPSALDIGRGHIEAFRGSNTSMDEGEDGSKRTLCAYIHVKNFKSGFQ